MAQPSHSTPRRVLRWLERHAEEAIAGACLCTLTTLMFVQVVMRYVFRSPLSWSDELADSRMRRGNASAQKTRHARDRVACIALVVGKPVLDCAVDKGDHDRENREDGKCGGVQPGRQQRPAAGRDALAIDLHEVDQRGDEE